MELSSNEKLVLQSFIRDADSGRFTSQDICDLLQDTVDLTPGAVTVHMLENGWMPTRIDDRLVWSKK